MKMDRNSIRVKEQDTLAEVAPDISFLEVI